MKKILKRLLIAAALFALLAVVLIAVAFTSGFQTWAAQKFLKDNPDLGVGLDKVSAGFGGAEVNGITYAKDGITAKVAQFKADLSVLGATGDHITVDAIIAKGIEIDLSQPTPAKPETSPTPAPETASSSPAQPFDGIFPLTKQIGKKLTVKVIDVDGKVKLPAGQSATFTVTGGDIAPGATGKVKLTLDYANSTAGAQVSGSKVTVDLGLAQLTEGGFSAILVDILSKVQGAALKGAPEASVKIKLEEVTGGESYSVKVIGLGAELVDLNAKFDRASGGFTAAYKLSATDTQVAPLAMGMALPPFTLKGDGSAGFDPKSGASSVKTNLAFNLTDLTNLKALLESQKLDPALVAQLDATFKQIGALSFVTKLDAGVQGNNAKVTELEFLLQDKSSRTLLRAATLAPLTIDLKNPAALPDAARLASIELDSLPLAWASAFAPGLNITGDGVSMTLDVGVQKGVALLQATKPLTIANLTIGANATKEAPAAPLVDAITLKLAPTASYDIAKGNFVAEIPALTVDDRNGQLAKVLLKASGDSAGKDIKARIETTLSLSGLVRQPVLSALREGLQEGVTLTATVDAGVAGSLAALKVSPLVLSQRNVPITTLTLDTAVDLSKPAGLLPVTVTNLAVKGDVSLPELFRQPMLASLDNLLRGELKLDLAAQGQPNGDFKFNGNVNLQNLLPRGGKSAPGMKLALDGKLGADRSISLNAPLTLSGKGTTDLAIVAQAKLPEKGDITFDLNVDSKRVVVDDLTDLATAFSNPNAKPVETPAVETAPKTDGPVNTAPDTKPVWAGIVGKGTVKIGEVVLGNGSLVKGFTANLKVDANGVAIAPISAQFGDDKFEAGAQLNFKPGAKPYDLDAKLSLPNFDSGAYFQKAVPNKLPLIEGKFVILGTAAGSAANLGVLADALTGSFTFKSMGGKFRPFEYSEDFDKVDGATNAVGAAAGLLGAFGVKDKTVNKIAETAAKVTEVLDELRVMDYAQMTADGERAKNLDINLRELSITSESFRLVTTGKVTYVDGLSYGQSPISFPVTVWCHPRSEMARKLNNIGLLTEEQDPRGYLKGFTYETTGTFEKTKSNIKDVLTKAAGTYFGGGKINLASYRTGAPPITNSTPTQPGTPAPTPVPTPTPVPPKRSLLGDLLGPPTPAPTPPPAAPATTTPGTTPAPVPTPTPPPAPKASDVLRGLLGK